MLFNNGLVENQSKNQSKSKKVSLIILTATAMFLICSGTFFSVYSFIYSISFKVLNTNVSGVIFGLLVIYLGIRYLLSLKKLKAELYKTNEKFSWDNFKRKTKVKAK